MKTIIKHFEVRNRVFTIVHDQDHYLAIEDKYLDERGCLKVALCGPQMHAMRNLDDCLKQVTSCVEIDYLTSQGMDLAEAFCKVQGIECTDAIRDVFAQCAANRAG